MKAELLDVLGSDLTVVNAARVSFDKWHDQFDLGSDTKLIKYLATHGHWTPFGQPQIQMRIKAPIFVARQLFRSNAGTVRSEVSRRYVDSAPEFFTPTEWRSRPDGSIKQGSGEPMLPYLQYKAELMYAKAVEQCVDAYNALLAWGIAPEQARMVLPQSMMTSWVETASLAYWARVYKLRTDAHAQAEIQDLARQIGDIIAPLFPVSWAALVAPVVTET